MVKIYALVLTLLSVNIALAQDNGANGTDCGKRNSNQAEVSLPKLSIDHIRFEDGKQPFVISTADKTLPAIMKSTNAMLNESFEIDVPPVGWSATNFSKSTTSLESKAPGNTGHFAYFWASASVGTIGNLVTPKLAPASGNNTLSYKVNYIVYDASWVEKGAAMYIEFSEDAGKTWTTSTINELEALPNYNSSTTGWATNTVDLSAYEGKEVMLRFRCEADYGQGFIGIDDVTGPEAVYYTNDISGKFYQASMKNMGFCQYVPFHHLDTVIYYARVKNNGLAVQTNVTLHADINNGEFLASEGLRNPQASFAFASIDTMSVFFGSNKYNESLYKARLWLTQDETDEVPDNNKLDSICFETTSDLFLRTNRARIGVSSYYYSQTSVPTISGFEYGARYTMKHADRIREIKVAIIKSVGTGTIVGKLYTVTSGASGNIYTLVAQTAPFSPPAGEITDWTNLAFNTSYIAPTGAKLAAMIQLNITPGKDTIWIGMDNQFVGSTASGSLAYMNVKPSGGTAAMGWYTLSYEPVVGLVAYLTVCDGLDDENKNVNNNSISVYPNPANDQVNLSNIGKDARVIMLNAMGQVVYTTSASDNLTIPTTEMKDGLYYIRVNENVFKVVIAK